MRLPPASYEARNARHDELMFALRRMADRPSAYTSTQIRQITNEVHNWADALLADLKGHKSTRQITMQDVRLLAGEGKLSAETVLQAVNAIRAREIETLLTERNHLADTLSAYVQDYEERLDRRPTDLLGRVAPSISEWKAKDL